MTSENEIQKIILLANKIAAKGTEIEKSAFCSVNSLLESFTPKYKTGKEKLPYHINLIDLLHANENAHSRILEKLLQQQNTNKRFEILESFIKYITEKYRKKTDFQKIQIQNPQITQEKARIDLWIRDTDYAIVIENKVAYAGDQPNQLERYIDITKDYEFQEKQIYVLYLPPTYEKEPDKQTWGKYFEKDIHKNRYLKLSFKDDILPWLKESVIPRYCNTKDTFLCSALEQYANHLEGKFNLRLIDKEMNKELQQFIRESLGLTKSPKENLSVLSEKKEMLSNVLNQLTAIEKEDGRAMALSLIFECKELLQKNYPQYGWDGEPYFVAAEFMRGNEHFSLSIMAEDDKVYYGVETHNRQRSQSIEEWLQSLQIPDVRDDPGYYFYESVAYESLYSKFVNLLDKIIKNLNKNN